ncbi:pyocin knob domain-containing protein, partial [Xenorhabdus sp. XENO-1]|nr:pyocin knob domain-containing protein [Xenorhabdus bovienii subsp. africana]
DLNNITAPGIYAQFSSEGAYQGKNYPSTMAGTLIVHRSAGVIQEYIEYHSGTSYRRALQRVSTDNWTDWDEILTATSSKIKQKNQGTMAAFMLNGMLIQAGSIIAPTGTTSRYSLPSSFKSFAYVVGGVGPGSGHGVNAGVKMVGLNQIEVSRAVNADPIQFIAVGDY